MTALARWGVCGSAAGVLLLAGALLAQDAVDRGVGGTTLWTGEAAGILWLVGVALCAASATAASVTRAVLLAVLALAWISPVFGAWTSGVPALIALAPAAAACAGAALWHLLLDGTVPRSVIRRWAIGGVWGATALAAFVLVFLREPFLDARCRGVCGSNPLLVIALPPLVAAAHLTVAVLTLVIALGAVIWSAIFLMTRRTLGPLSPTPAIVVLAIGGALTELMITDMVSSRVGEPLLAAALALLAAESLWTAVMRRSRLAALHRLADDLATSAKSDAGDLEVRLATALRDPGLQVLYPIASDGWVDASGSEQGLPEDATLTPVRRQGTTIAMIAGRAGSERDLEIIGGAAGLAIDNERLRALIAAHVAELRASRLRVVEAGDEERRRIERNLHDGMQQSLLVLQYELGLAASRADLASDEAHLADLRHEAHRITERLREIARGVFPAALDDMGVVAALQHLADDAPFPIQLSGDPRPRPPRPIERTVYLVADEALAAGASKPGVLIIDVEREPEAVTVRTANSRAQTSRTLRDRIEALGGHVAVQDDGIEVLLPCASS
jgi:signal transduction histidine kinase